MRGLTTADASPGTTHWYAPDNAIVVIAGDVTMEQVRPLAEKYYGVIAGAACAGASAARRSRRNSRRGG